MQGKIVIDRQDIDDFIMANEFKSSDQIREILKEKKFILDKGNLEGNKSDIQG